MIKANELNRLITFKSKVVAVDALNYPAHDGTFTDVATVYAKEIAATGINKFENEKEVYNEKRAFVIRTDPGLVLLPDMVFSTDDKHYEITRINNYKGSIRYQVVEGVYKDNVS